MHVRGHRFDPVIDQPLHQPDRSLRRVAVALPCDANGPRHQCTDVAARFDDRGLDSSDGSLTFAKSHDPVQPQLSRRSRPLRPLRVPVTQLLERRGFPTCEFMQRRIGKHRSHLVGSVDSQRTENQPRGDDDGVAAEPNHVGTITVLTGRVIQVDTA